MRSCVNQKIWHAAQQEASATIEKEEALAPGASQTEKAKQEAIDYADQLAERAEDLEEQWSRQKAERKAE